MGNEAFQNASFGNASFPNANEGNNCLWALITPVTSILGLKIIELQAFCF